MSVEIGPHNYEPAGVAGGQCGICGLTIFNHPADPYPEPTAGVAAPQTPSPYSDSQEDPAAPRIDAQRLVGVDLDEIVQIDADAFTRNQIVVFAEEPIAASQRIINEATSEPYVNESPVLTIECGTCGAILEALESGNYQHPDTGCHDPTTNRDRITNTESRPNMTNHAERYTEAAPGSQRSHDALTEAIAIATVDSLTQQIEATNLKVAQIQQHLREFIGAPSRVRAVLAGRTMIEWLDKLIADSHPPKPVVPRAEFDRVTQELDRLMQVVPALEDDVPQLAADLARLRLQVDTLARNVAATTLVDGELLDPELMSQDLLHELQHLVDEFGTLGVAEALVKTHVPDAQRSWWLQVLDARTTPPLTTDTFVPGVFDSMTANESVPESDQIREVTTDDLRDRYTRLRREQFEEAFRDSAHDLWKLVERFGIDRISAQWVNGNGTEIGTTYITVLPPDL